MISEDFMWPDQRPTTFNKGTHKKDLEIKKEKKIHRDSNPSPLGSKATCFITQPPRLQCVFASMNISSIHYTVSWLNEGIETKNIKRSRFSNLKQQECPSSTSRCASWAKDWDSKTGMSTQRSGLNLMSQGLLIPHKGKMMGGQYLDWPHTIMSGSVRVLSFVVFLLK